MINNMKEKDIINSCKVTRQDVPFCKPKVSKEDIVCYKIIERKRKDAYSIFGHGKYPEEICSGSVVCGRGIWIKNNWFKRFFFNKPEKEYIEESIEWNYTNQWYDITFGFIHALSYRPQEIKGYLPIHAGKYELWECIIPKKTIYYQANTRGSHSETSNSYAAKKIQFIKKLEDCDYAGWFLDKDTLNGDTHIY